MGQVGPCDGSLYTGAPPFDRPYVCKATPAALGALLVAVTWGLPLLLRNSVPAAALLQAQVLRAAAAAAELHQLHQPEHVL